MKWSPARCKQQRVRASHNLVFANIFAREPDENTAARLLWFACKVFIYEFISPTCALKACFGREGGTFAFARRRCCRVFCVVQGDNLRGNHPSSASLIRLVERNERERHEAAAAASTACKKRAPMISELEAVKTLFPLFCPRIISIPLHKTKMRFRYKAGAVGA